MCSYKLSDYGLGRFELPDLEVNYRSKKLLTSLNDDLKKHLFSLSIRELKQLQIAIKATTKKLNSLQKVYEKAVQDAFYFAAEIDKLVLTSETAAFEQYPVIKYSWRDIFTGNTDQVDKENEKREKERNEFVKELEPIFHSDEFKSEFALFDAKMLAPVTKQWETLAKLVPKEILEMYLGSPLDPRQYVFKTAIRFIDVTLGDYNRSDLSVSVGGPLEEGGFYGFFRFQVPEYFSRYGSNLISPYVGRLFNMLAIKMLPAIPLVIREKEKKDASFKVKKKQKERSATLAAYEDKSRNIGQSLMKKMRSDVSSPFYCPYCFNRTSKVQIHIDHINPVSNGGLSVERNLVPVCSACNLAKKDMSLRSFCKKNNLDFELVCDTLEDMGKFI